MDAVTTEQPPPPPHQQPQPQPQPDDASRFLKLSSTAFIWVMIGVVLLCVGAPIAMCLFCGLGSLITGATTPHTVGTP